MARLLYLYTVVVLWGLYLQVHSAETSSSGVIDDLFHELAQENHLKGATLGVLHHHTLTYAKGQGLIRGHHAHARSVVPVLGFSKLFTAVAILQLVENEKLKLHDRVFGNHGVLYYLQPPKPAKLDPRFLDITVRDLLYHSGGWDESRGPIYDPLLNAWYRRQGINVTDIGREMGSFGPIDLDDVLRFMVGRRLDFPPGTQRKESNFGYSLLGRIVEEKTKLDYEVYVKKYILKPAGMWQTRLDPPHSALRKSTDPSLRMLSATKAWSGYAPVDPDLVRCMFDTVPAQMLDSCLGWHSNVYDLARFFRALFKRRSVLTKPLLKPETVEDLILEPAFSESTSVGDMSGNLIDGIGFKANSEGSFWFESHNADIGSHVMLYHQGPPIWNNVRSSTDEGILDTAVILLGVSSKEQPKLLPNLSAWTQDSLSALTSSTVSSNDALLEDLADSHVTMNGVETLVAYKISEHHINTYMDAMKVEGYSPTWVHGYKHGGNSYFATIFQRKNSSPAVDYIFLKHPSKTRMVSEISSNIKDGYQLTFVQSYVSASRHNQLCHVAVMEKSDHPLSVEFDLSADLDSYFISREEAIKDGFSLAVQSVDVEKNKIYVTYMITQKQQLTLNKESMKIERKPNEMEQTEAFHDLSLEQLKQTATANIQRRSVLVYLDTFTAHGQPRFSAIYRKQSVFRSWILATQVPAERLAHETAHMRAAGYVPRLMASYDAAGKHSFAVVYVLGSAS